MTSSTRRAFMVGGGVVAVGAATALGRGPLSSASGWDPLLAAGDAFNYRMQRLAILHRPLVPVYDRSMITKNHPSEGGIGSSYSAPGPRWHDLHATNFKDWRLNIGGLVDRPLSLSLDQLRRLPTQNQITLHACDRGWSAIAEWTGVPLRVLLGLAGVQDGARYVVLRCLDTIFGLQVFTSIDLLDALHPQTLIAHSMNGQTLPVRHGAPVRLRIELQIGYKNVKHIESITLVPSLEGLGRGGFAENGGAFQWYAGM